MANEKLFHIGVKALITNSQGKFLVAFTSGKDFTVPGPNHGDLIGGRIEVGQEPVEALKREIEEEAGVTDVGHVSFLTAVISQIQIKLSDDTMAGLALLVYNVQIPDNIPLRLSDEHSKFEWLSPAEAADALEYKFGREFSDYLRRVGAAEQLTV
jgi:8-oxo-dGTP pyrophosphatase MutT (NUDIX family)